jgi:hypothetical protein
MREVSSPVACPAECEGVGEMIESVELDLQRERAAKNQSLFREVNERITELSGPASFASFICECANESCDETVSLTREEYEWVRSDSTSFFMIAGHEILDIEEIIDASDRYVVVAKLGTGAAIAERLDPRKRASVMVSV